MRFGKKVSWLINLISIFLFVLVVKYSFYYVSFLTLKTMYIQLAFSPIIVEFMFFLCQIVGKHS